MTTTIGRTQLSPSRMATVRHRLGRIVDWLLEQLRVPPPGLRTPPPVTAPDDYPVVLLAQLGADSDAVHQTLEAVPALCNAAQVRVVLVIDQPDLVAARRAGVPVELLPARLVWEERHVARAWDELVRHRLALIRRDYAAAAVVRAPGGGLRAGDFPQLVAALRADGALRRQRSWWRRHVVTAVRLVDRPVVTK